MELNVELAELNWAITRPTALGIFVCGGAIMRFVKFASKVPP